MTICTENTQSPIIFHYYTGWEKGDVSEGKRRRKKIDTHQRASQSSPPSAQRSQIPLGRKTTKKAAISDSIGEKLGKKIPLISQASTNKLES